MTTTATATKPITERAAIQRINRSLSPQYEFVGISCGKREPRYYHLDTYNNSLLGQFDDLESWARDEGCLADDEYIVGQHNG